MRACCGVLRLLDLQREHDDEEVEMTEQAATEIGAIAGQVVKHRASEWMMDNYRTYAVYTVLSRALVDVDGLKPVMRRVLYSMYRNGITPKHAFVKAARVTGNTFAYHPHGDSSINDALTRMAQGFIQRVPLIDAYGTVGKHAGDTAAAARYWEARLTPAAMELLDDINAGGVPEQEMGRNYDNTEDEPVRLPARWPSGIVNGFESVTVGFQTSGACHNPTETMNAARRLLAEGDLSIDDLMEVMPGPDFPTGGVVIGTDGIRDYYATGRGSFVMRGRCKVNHLTRGKVEFLFYELPYQVSAESVIQQIQNAKSDEKRPHLQDVESAKDFTDKNSGISLSIVTKAGSNYHEVLSELYARTKLETSFHVNNTTLIDGTPQQTGMVESLRHFLSLRMRVVRTKAERRRLAIAEKLEQLRAIEAVLVDIDKAVAIIRNADDAQAAKAQLRTAFDLNDTQAEYILRMQLRRLTKADALETQSQVDALEQEDSHLAQVLSDPQTLAAVVDEELKRTTEVIADERRTEIQGMTVAELKDKKKALQKQAKASSKNGACVVYTLPGGALYRVLDGQEMPYSYTDKVELTTNGTMSVVGTRGTAHQVPVAYIPEGVPCSPDDLGAPFEDGEKFAGITSGKANKTYGVLMVTDAGTVKLSKMDWPVNKTSYPVFSVKEGENIVAVRTVKFSAKAVVGLFSSDGSLALFDLSAVRASGSKAGGVAGMKLREGAKVVAMSVIPTTEMPSAVVLTLGTQTVKLTPLEEYDVKGRGGMGVRTHSLRAKEPEMLDGIITTSPAVTLAGDITSSLDVPVPSKRDATGARVPLDMAIGEHAKENDDE